jgi:alcohol dehydrogenase
MKAAILEKFGSPLSVQRMPDPVLGTGEVLVDVVATRVLPYADEVLSGARNYLLDTPVVPGVGAVARVRAVGPDATHLSVGDWVFCDPTVRSRDDALAPDILLQGLTAGGAGGLRLQQHFRHGSWAERMMVPTENAIPLGALEEAEAVSWCALSTMLVPYGGFLSVNLQPGETVLVSGATGNFGSAGVGVALAMGARAVIAPGRNEKMLADLVRRFGERVHPVVLSGQEEEDRKRMAAAAPGPIDCVLDLMPPSVSTTVVRAAAMTVRPYGRVVLMGGITDEALALPYRWLMRNCITARGQWMYPREATSRLINLGRAGLLRLDQFEATVFDLDHISEAVAHAAAAAARSR